MTRLLALASLILLVATPAASRPQPAPAAQPDQTAGAPVIWQGRELYRVYGSYGPFTPEERARLATARIERAVRESYQVESITLRHQETVTEV